VLRLNENATSDPGLDRARELTLHTAAANAGIAPQVVYADPSHFCLITDYLDGRLWTPHYFHAHARSAFARATSACVAVSAATVGAALRPHGLRATLCRH
jgi:hypothetical protein